MMLPLLVPLVLSPLPFAGAMRPGPLPEPPGSRTIQEAEEERSSEELEADLADLRRQLVGAYLALAEWCEDERLYLQRDLFYEAILEVDTDHEEARKELGYRPPRGDETEWRRGSYRVPTDRGKPEAMDRLEEQRALRADLLLRRLQVVLGFPRLTKERREREAGLYLALAPDHAGLRKLVGQSLAPDGTWVDRRLLLTRERREQLETFAHDARAAVPELEPWSPEGDVAQVELSWQAGFQTTRVKLAGTVTEEEVRHSTEVVHMLEDLLAQALPWEEQVEMIGRGNVWRPRNPEVLHSRFTVYLLEHAGQLSALMSAFPKLSSEERELFPYLSTGWLSKSRELGVWQNDPEKRLDGLVRQIIGRYLQDTFQLSARNGWVWEGLGLYLTHLAIGTRLTFTVKPSTYIDNEPTVISSRLTDRDADWLALLLEEQQKPRPPKLVFLLGKDVNSLTLREVLLSYGLCAYLIEVYPERFPDILRRLGQGEDPLRLLEGEFGRSMPTIQEDVESWIRLMLGV